jgi:hypothetical protein
MKFRKLRIAWSVAWGVVAVSLCGLWVRSYWWWDVMAVAPNHSLASMNGSFLWDTPLGMVPRPGRAMPASQSPPLVAQSVRLDDVIILPFDDRIAVYDGRAMSFPIWWAVVGAMAVGATGWWIRLRYSLRTLLVAMTLAAVGLWVWVSR